MAKAPKFLILGIDKAGFSVYRSLQKGASKEAAIKRAGELAATCNPNCIQGYAVYECIGMATKPEIPVNFVTIESMES
jgi:hypothetical protein